MPGQTLNERTLLELLEGTGVEAPGWYGKMPALGDFASRRLPQHFVDACDAWLAQGIDMSRAQLGERWLEVYLNGPLWRFAWAPQVVDGQWWYGVIMPSVDKVGRYFPLVIARTSPHAPASLDACHLLQSWYSHVSSTALGALRPGATLEEFESSLARSPATVDGRAALPSQATPLPGRIRHTVPGPMSLADWAKTLVIGDAVHRLSGQSFWWPDHADAPDNSMSVAQGLPAAAHFSELLEGRW